MPGAGEVSRWPRARAQAGWRGHLGIEGLAVLADGQGERHEFLEGFVGLVEADRNGPGIQFHAVREPREILPLELAKLDRGYLDQHGRLPQPLLAELRQVFPEVLAAALFVPGFLSGRDALEMSEDVGAAGDQAGAHAPLGKRSQELLGATAADAEQRLDGRPVHPGIGGVVFQLADGLGKAVEPQGFIRHAEHRRSNSAN